MGWTSFVKRRLKKVAKRAARTVGRKAVKFARKRGRRLISRAVRIGGVAGATSLGGPIAGGIAAKLLIK